MLADKLVDVLNQGLAVVFGNRNDRLIGTMESVAEEVNRLDEEFTTLSDAELRHKTEEFRERLRPSMEKVEEARRKQTLAGRQLMRARTREERKPLQAGVTRAEYALQDAKAERERALDEILPEAFAAVRQACRRLVGRSWAASGIPIYWQDVPFDVQVIGAIALHSPASVFGRMDYSSGDGGGRPRGRRGNITEMVTGEGKTLVATMPAYLNALVGKVHIVTVNDFLARRDRDWMGPVYEMLGLSAGAIQSNMPDEERQAAYACDIIYGTSSEFGFDYLRDNMKPDLAMQCQGSLDYAIVDEVDSILIDEARTPLILSGPTTQTENQFAEWNGAVERLVRLQRRVIQNLIGEARRLISEGDEEGAARRLVQMERGDPKNKVLPELLKSSGLGRKVKQVQGELSLDKTLEEALDEELYYVVEERQRRPSLTEKGLKELFPDAEALVLRDIEDEKRKIETDPSLTTEEKVRQRSDLEARREQIEQETRGRAEVIHTITQLLVAHTFYERDVEYVVDSGQIIIVDERTGRLQHGRVWSDGLHQAVEAKEGLKVREETQTWATITIQNFFRMYDKLAGMTGTAATEANEFKEIYGLDVVLIPTNRPLIRTSHPDRVFLREEDKWGAIVDEVEEVHACGRPVLVGTVSIEKNELLSGMLRRRGIPHEVLNAKQHQREAQVVAQAGQTGAVTVATNMAGRGTDIRLGEGVAEMGGLHIVGTERYEARRIDNQLRGRAGRQGDPGSSRFYVALEDDLMRIFAGDWVRNFLARMGMADGLPIDSALVSRQIEKAQKRVEEHNFDWRKNVLEYDEVMNEQRKIVYEQRQEILRGESLRETVLDMLRDVVEDAAVKYAAEGDLRGLTDWCRRNLGLAVPFDDVDGRSEEELRESLYRRALEHYEERERIVGPDQMRRLEQLVLLQTLDMKWKDHLYDMDQLQGQIGLRGYAQKDPKIEYKREGYEIFEEMVWSVKEEVTRLLLRLQLAGPPVFRRSDIWQADQAQAVHREYQTFNAEREQAMAASQQGEEKPKPFVFGGARVGRNDPCPCGSRKKYKKCCGRGR